MRPISLLLRSSLLRLHQGREGASPSLTTSKVPGAAYGGEEVVVHSTMIKNHSGAQDQGPHDWRPMIMICGTGRRSL